MNLSHVPCQSRARIASNRERDSIWEVRGEEVRGEEVRGEEVRGGGEGEEVRGEEVREKR